MVTRPHKCLIIKYGSLGDIVQALPAIYQVNRHPQIGSIKMITTPPYVGFLQASGWLEDVIGIKRPHRYSLDQLLLAYQILKGRYDYVIDLQNSRNTKVLFSCVRFLAKALRMARPKWCSLNEKADFVPKDIPAAFDQPGLKRALWQVAPLLFPKKRLKHKDDIDLFINDTDLDWLNASFGFYEQERRPRVVLVPGSSAGNQYKRWPIEAFIKLVKLIDKHNFQPVLVGGEAEQYICTAIAKECKSVINLCAQTDLFQLAGLMRRAKCVIGNDTGPVHMAALLGAPTITLLGPERQGDWSGAFGPNAHKLIEDKGWAHLSPETVWDFAIDIL